MNARVVAIIQARMGSTRLPGKVLLPLRNRPVLEWVIRAARSAAQVDDVVVATSAAVEDDAIVAVCDQLGVTTVRGSESDVLSRFVLAAEAADADAIVRLTADCPLLDPRLIDQVVALWRADQPIDYVSTTLHRTLPRGLDVELISRPALERADETATGSDRAHVSSVLYREHSPTLRSGIIFGLTNADLRVTLDVGEDYEMLTRLVWHLPDKPPSWRSVVTALRDHPEIATINSGVQQKQISDG